MAMEAASLPSAASMVTRITHHVENDVATSGGGGEIKAYGVGPGSGGNCGAGPGGGGPIA